MTPQAHIVAAAAATALLVLPIRTQAADPLPTPAPILWQTVITTQIQAYRDKDAVVAFRYAGADFQAQFTDPRAFFAATIAAGYDTIMDSQTQNFGQYRLFEDNSVLQEVTLFGRDQSLYTAVFALAEEPGGWRIEAVILQKQDAIGV